MNLDELPQNSADESAAERQLRVGFPWLRFEDDLERNFARVQSLSRLGQIRFNLWLSMAVVVGFALLNDLVGATQVPAVIYALQFGLLVPVIGATVATTYLPSAHRIYSKVARFAATLAGLVVVAIEIKAAQAHLPALFLPIFLTSVFVYYLVGLFFYEALRVNAIMWCAYLAFGIVAGLPESTVMYNAILLLFTNVVGATVAYTFEVEIRTHFLEQQMLLETAARDGLTGIFNRRRFDEHLDTVWQMAQREGVTLALLLVDIDFFKRFNDRNGHQAGDECLRAVATGLRRAARRPLDFVARYGGEEFAVIL